MKASKENKIAGIISLLVTMAVSFVYNQIIFYPNYTDVSNCGQTPIKLPEQVVGDIVDCFPRYREVSRVPIYLIVFVGVPVLTFLFVKVLLVVKSYVFKSANP